MNVTQSIWAGLRAAPAALSAATKAAAGAFALVAVLAWPLSATAEARTHKPAAGAGVLEDRYIVVYESSVTSVAGETERQERARGFRARFEYRRAVKGFAARLSEPQVRKLRADPDVAYVTPDRVVKALGAVPLAAGEPAPPTGVRRMGAATATMTREASDVGVAVIDTGVDLSHPDLNAVSGANCVTPGTPAQDDNGHGTHVAGTVGARNNGAGVVGVAPGTRVYGVKVLDSTGSGSWSQVLCGIDWVTANAASLNIKVANMSLGGPGSNDRNCGRTDGDVLHQAICRSTQAGVTQVVAAGNDGWNIGDSPPDVPASYPEVLTVAAMSDSDGAGGGAGPAPLCRVGESDDAYARFSNYGTRPADTAHMIAAPGVCIRSTWPGGGYNTISGTSMASPHAAGAVALCLSEGGVSGPCAGKTPAQIVEQMRADAQGRSSTDSTHGFAGDPLRPNSWGDYFGHLMHVPADTTPPDTSITAGPSSTTRSTSASLSFGATEASSTFECKLDARAWEACASPRSYSSLADGTHTFSVRARDAAGNTDASPATRSWTVDTAAPETSIASGPSGLTNDSTPTFGLASSETGSSFECRVDTGAWSSCTSPHTTAALADGAHGFTVRATDAAGNVDATPASRSLTVDATAPDTTITAGPDAVTKSRTPTFDFSTTDAGAALQCRVDGAAWASCASPYRTGELADGPHTFEVRAVDAAGNPDLTPAARSFRVDPTELSRRSPTASSAAASDVGETSATVGGTVNPNGQSTTYQFEYGTTTAYGARTDAASAGAGTAETIVAATLSGLTPGTTYHYRIVATNASGATVGEDRTLTTAAAAPARAGDPPTAPAPPAAEPPADQPSTPAPAPAADSSTDWAYPAAVDAAPPATTVSIPRQGLRSLLRTGLRASFTSSEPASVAASLTLDGRTAKRLGLSRGNPVTVARGSGSLTGSGQQSVVLKLTRTARARLARVSRLRVSLRARLADRAGNGRTVVRAVTLRR